MPTGTILSLRDSHLPDGISAWPPAIGWWVLIGLLVLAALAAVWLYRRHQGQRLRREALRTLSDIEGQYKKEQDDQALIQSLSTWLRRVCISHYPIIDVAGLTGNDWLRLLDRNLAATPTPQAFSDGVGQCLLSGPYQRGDAEDGVELLALCRSWIMQLPRKKRAGA